MPPVWRICSWRSIRRRQLPTPTLPTPKRRELIDDIELEPADPAFYDRFATTRRRIPMARPDNPLPTQLDRDLAELKLLEIAKGYAVKCWTTQRAGQFDVGGAGHTHRHGTDRSPATRPGAAAAAGTTAQAKDSGRLQFRLPQTRSQDSHCASLRLRVHPAPWLRRPDWSDRNRKDAFAHRPGLHRLPSVASVAHAHAWSLCSIT